MKRILGLGAFTLTFLILLPVRSEAGEVPPANAHGFGPLKAFSLNFAPWIHHHGPLYNYGPYNDYSQGYLYMQFSAHQLGYYRPAYPINNYGAYPAYPAPLPVAPVVVPVVPVTPVVPMVPLVPALPLPATRSPSDPLSQYVPVVPSIIPTSYSQPIAPTYVAPRQSRR